MHKAKEVIEENTKGNYPENVCVIPWSSSMADEGRWNYQIIFQRLSKHKAKEVIKENTKGNYPEDVCIIRWSLSMDDGYGIVKNV